MNKYDDTDYLIEREESIEYEEKSNIEEDEKIMIARQEGKEEGRKCNFIKNALENNLPIETIAIALDLSVDEVKNIIKENNLDKLSE